MKAGFPQTHFPPSRILKPGVTAIHEEVTRLQQRQQRVEDIGFDIIKSKVKKPLEGIKIASKQ
jgi:hypothetical protein